MAKPSIKQRWTTFQKAEFGGDRPPSMSENEELWRNATHTVFVHAHHVDSGLPDPKDGWVTLSIKRNDRAAECDWRIFMRIKNELLGPDREAMQIFPSMDRVVDTANQYFLFVAPKGFVLGVGFLDRLVMDQQQSTEANEQAGFSGAPKQRDFLDGCPIGELAGSDPRPGTTRESVFPIPLYPHQVLDLMRKGLQYQAEQRSDDGNDAATEQ